MVVSDEKTCRECGSAASLVEGKDGFVYCALCDVAKFHNETSCFEPLQGQLNVIADYLAVQTREKGFFTPTSISGSSGQIMLAKLMLLVSEVAEAAEAIRHNNLPNFTEEMADILIRLLDICGSMKLDIERALIEKTLVNEHREYRHGTQQGV